MYNDEQIKQYLNKIQYAGDREITLENLRKLHYQHLLHIPYENLDQMNGVPLSLTPDALFHKMILKNRGGYCFELQGLFGFLLKSLGYDVMQYAGRFMNEPWHIQMRRHRILVISLEGKRYVCDVGVRQESSRYPLELKEGLVQTDGFSEYRYEKDSFYGWVLMQKLAGKEWKQVLGFTEEPQIDDDYIMPSFYCEMHPESTFNKFMKVSVFDEESNLTIEENEYRVFRGGKVVERLEMKTDEEARRVLEMKFGINVPQEYRMLSAL